MSFKVITSGTINRIIDIEFDDTRGLVFESEIPLPITKLKEIPKLYPPQPVKKLTKEEIGILEDHLRKQGRL